MTARKSYGEPLDWISKSGKWTVTISSGKIRVDDRTNGFSYFGHVDLNNDIVMDDEARGKLPGHLKKRIEKMATRHLGGS